MWCRVLPEPSGSPRPPMVVPEGAMLEGCSARLVRGWSTTLAGSPPGSPEARWEVRPASEVRE